MGQRGPQPQSNKIKKLRGAKRLNESEVNLPTAIDPDPPVELNTEEREVWRSVCRTLAGFGAISSADLRLVARYVIDSVEWDNLRKLVAREGLSVEKVSSKGTAYLVKRPELSRIEFLEPQLLRYEQHLGLTPSSRTALALRPTADQDEVERKLFGDTKPPDPFEIFLASRS